MDNGSTQGLTTQHRNAESQGLLDPNRLAALARSCLMDTASEEIFDRAVRLAAQITGRPVALLSLIDDSRQFFKAQVGLPDDVAKMLHTPLSHSLCKHVVASQSDLMISDAQLDVRVRDNGAVTDMDVSAYLGVPVRDADGYVLGSLCVIDTSPHVWTDAEKRAMYDLRAMVETDLSLRDALRANEMLLQEFNHRIRNLFTVFMGLVRITARSAQDVEDMSGTLISRLSAMDVAQKLVVPTATGPNVADDHWQLSDLAAQVLAPYMSDAITVGTVPCTMGPTAATALALILHELATNAVKYGSLAQPEGTLSLDWKVRDETLVLTWSELLDGIGAAHVDQTTPTRVGFGTTLLKINIEQELGGTQDRVFSANEMRLTVRIPVSSLAH